MWLGLRLGMGWACVSGLGAVAGVWGCGLRLCFGLGLCLSLALCLGPCLGMCLCLGLGLGAAPSITPATNRTHKSHLEK